MSTDLNASFNEQFMNINTKLKKRFLRKPNISEATNEFIALAIQCEYSEQPTFAGHCYIGAAKCEASVGNFLGEAEYLVTAARQFMKAEKKLRSLKFCSPDRENLEAAIGCFTQALTKYPERSSIRLSLLSELAADLVTLNLKCEAVSYFEQALALVQEPTMKIMFVKNYINLLIDCEKYDIALEKSNELIDSNVNLPEDVLAEIQLSRILLSLYMDPKREAKVESLKQLFTDILNDVDSEAIPFNTDLRLKLQSAILSATSRDTQALARAACDLRPALTPAQQHLLARPQDNVKP
ncbi:40-kDa huntingtin-associated protein [Leguminivora glycinivorella]|uniref:40-kDa huntingtin-associated protein n=1 Tax=Leguminivora glycinivorella TaxID=1035111 RepID=UPI00200D0693|nr:40-kDa huntingtin-associated protein [Leguminivora glycinivorella]